MTENQFYKNLSSNLKEIRKSKGMTQEQFALFLNIGFYYYQRIEAPNTNQTISINLLIQITNSLEIELTDLLKPSSN